MVRRCGGGIECRPRVPGPGSPLPFPLLLLTLPISTARWRSIPSPLLVRLHTPLRIRIRIGIEILIPTPTPRRRRVGVIASPSSYPVLTELEQMLRRGREECRSCDRGRGFPSVRRKGVGLVRVRVLGLRLGLLVVVTRSRVLV